jgi:glycosyltransferase involved in cell wall biosynthesis
MRIAIVGNFGLGYKATMSARAMPIARELARHGHTVGVFVPADGGSVVNEGAGPRIFQIRFSAPRQSRRATDSLFGHLGVSTQLMWQVLRFRPDVLYAFKPKAYAGLALLIVWAMRRVGLGHVALALDADDWEGIGGWADRDPGPWWQRRLTIWQEAWCLRHADVVTVASQELAWLASCSNPAVVYAPNAASPTSPGWRQGDGRRIRAAQHLGDDPVVLAYTRFVEFVPARLFATFQAIVRAVPTAHLLVAGEGLRGEERSFAACAAGGGLANRVHVLGWTRPEVLPDVFAAADVALYLLDDTRLNRAKCPMKLVDLLLAGVAVVADGVGQANEYVVEGTTGQLTPPGDVEAMATAALSLLRDPARRSAFGTAARASILANWSWVTQAQQIESALRVAVARSHPR